MSTNIVGLQSATNGNPSAATQKSRLQRSFGVLIWLSVRELGGGVISGAGTVSNQGCCVDGGPYSAAWGFFESNLDILQPPWWHTHAAKLTCGKSCRETFVFESLLERFGLCLKIFRTDKL